MTLQVATLDCLYPRNSFFCGRTTRAMMGWNVANAGALPAYRLDATPAQLIGFAGGLPFVAHEAASTPLVLAFLRHCGLPGPEHLHRYQTAEEAAEIASNLISQGKRLVHNFGTLPTLEAPDGLLIPMDLYSRLNCKSALPNLVEPDHHPERELVSCSKLAATIAAEWTLPVFLKVAEKGSNGGGAAVRYCPDADALDAAIRELTARLSPTDAIIIEKDYGPVPSWCAGVAILDDEIRWLGASLQVFSKPASQSGSILLREAPPAEVKSTAMGIAHRARYTGYRGIAGFDVGIRREAGPVVFDLNFRPNSSTGLLLAGRAALNTTRLPVAHSFFLRHDGPLAALLDAVETTAAAGRLIPGSVFDRECYRETAHDTATRSCLDGWVLAESCEQARDWAVTISQTLSEQ